MFQMTLSDFTEKMNRWGKEKIPFLFIIDFEMLKPVIIRLEEIDPKEILFYINGFSNTSQQRDKRKITIKKNPCSLGDYKKKFDRVIQALEYGDTFLTNLTVATEVELTNTLEEIFHQSDAKYKLLYKDQFLVFSPETFIRIRDGKIFSYPMKGTIDASTTNAKEKILNDKKELAEHVTIVDLIRNDLSQVASQVNVKRFRYIDEVRTEDKVLYQVSSEICGELASSYETHLGDIVLKLLPAGSVSGAPKPKTLELIETVEDGRRGYYTGVCGVYNGDQLDSGVMIRYIEKTNDRYLYRSGGGITTQSDLVSEYQEVIDKVYVPVT